MEPLTKERYAELRVVVDASDRRPAKSCCQACPNEKCRQLGKDWRGGDATRERGSFHNCPNCGQIWGHFPVTRLPLPTVPDTTRVWLDKHGAKGYV